MANRESAIFAVKRRSSGLERVISVVLPKLVRRLPDYVHFLRNALDYCHAKSLTIAWSNCASSTIGANAEETRRDLALGCCVRPRHAVCRAGSPHTK